MIELIQVIDITIDFLHKILSNKLLDIYDNKKKINKKRRKTIPVGVVNKGSRVYFFFVFGYI